MTLAPTAALSALLNLPTTDEAPDLEVGPDLRFWQQAGRLALQALAGQHFMPVLVEDGGRCRALWRPLLAAPEVMPTLDALAGNMPPAARAASRKAAEAEVGPRQLLVDFVEATVDALARAAATHAPFTEAVRVPPSAWITSQSILSVIPEIAVRSTEARRARPMSRWISCVRPESFPDRSRGWRGWVEPGRRSYSAVIHPLPVPTRKGGTSSSKIAVVRTRVSPDE